MAMPSVDIVFDVTLFTLAFYSPINKSTRKEKGLGWYSIKLDRSTLTAMWRRARFVMWDGCFVRCPDISQCTEHSVVWVRPPTLYSFLISHGFPQLLFFCFLNPFRSWTVKSILLQNHISLMKLFISI